MRKKNTGSDFGTLIKFLENYNLSDITKNTPFRVSLKSLNKRLYPLLIWQYELCKRQLWPTNKQKSGDFELYLTETVSDACQSLLLFAQGVYKPASNILRSAVENFVRCVGIFENQKVTAVVSVYELMALVRKTDVIQSSVPGKKNFDNLVSRYSDLCKIVHSVDREYMTLTNALALFPYYEEKQAKFFSKTALSVFRSMLCILSLMFKHKYLKLHHRLKDEITDILPANVVKELTS